MRVNSEDQNFVLFSVIQLINKTKLTAEIKNKYVHYSIKFLKPRYNKISVKLLPGTAEGTLRRKAVTVASAICSGVALFAWLCPGVTIFGFSSVPSR